MDFSSNVEVELVEVCASDVIVAKAARVSTGNDTNVEGVAELVEYLMRNRHGSPFEHTSFTWRVDAPIFVWREHMRHRMASYNEISGRYAVLEPKFYVPAAGRPLVQQGKAGEYVYVAGSAQQYADTQKELRAASKGAYAAYLRMLDAGVAREVARMCLPVNIFSQAYVTMNARALMNFLSLRTKSADSAYPSYPQHEITLVADMYENDFASLMPATHSAFTRHGRVAP